MTALEMDAMGHEFTPQPLDTSPPSLSPPFCGDDKSFDRTRFLLADRTILPKFEGVLSARSFHAAYNGGSLFDSLTKWIGGATLTRSESKDLLADILEDALIGAGSHLMAPGHRVVRLDAQGEAALQLAIEERLPRVSPEAAPGMAVQLIEELKLALGSSHALAIDDGAVYWVDGHLEIADVGLVPVRFVRTPTGVETVTGPIGFDHPLMTT